MNRRSPLLLLGLAALAMCGACSKQNTSISATNITGTISYRIPVGFATKAKLELELTDVSITDGPAVQISTTTIDNLRALPYQYTLPYDAKLIDKRHRYTVAARIYAVEQLKYATDTAIAVLTQGNGAQVDIPVIAVGTNEATSAMTSTTAATNVAATDTFAGVLRGDIEQTHYRAGFADNHIVWLEEDRSGDKSPTLHARYEFKGALLLRYSDSSGFEFVCNDVGRPISASKNQQALVVVQQMAAINAARNRAALLRSHALSLRETQAHRIATKQDVSR